jgi:hypothetical protein
MTPATVLEIRLALLSLIGSSLTMMGIRVFQFRRLLEMPGGLAFVLETAVAHFAYGIAIMWTTASRDPLRRTVLLAGTWLGVAGAAVQIVHLTQETFMDGGPVWNAVSGFGFLFCAFLLWGIAGYRAAQTTGGVAPGALAGCWSAIVTMSFLITFGFVLEFYLAVPKPENVVTWGEFKRSGWTDVRAFTVVNTLDAAVSHLAIGPFLGAAIGAVVAAVVSRKAKRGATIAPP